MASIFKTIPSASRKYAPPVPASSKYLRSDQGIDWVSPDDIRAIASGTVTNITHGWHGGTGTGVYITFDQPIVVFGRVYRQMYSAESTPLVKIGDKVAPGQAIATPGSVEVGFWPSPLIGGLGAGSQPNQQSLDFGALAAALGSPVPQSGQAQSTTKWAGGSSGVDPAGIVHVVTHPGQSAQDAAGYYTKTVLGPIASEIMYGGVIAGGAMLMLLGFALIGLDLGLAAFKTVERATPLGTVTSRRRQAKSDTRSDERQDKALARHAERTRITAESKAPALELAREKEKLKERQSNRRARVQRQRMKIVETKEAAKQSETAKDRELWRSDVLKNMRS